ncbi:MAG: 4Fe-4S dicluster domain-containing protein [Calditrichaeota bacterium]|nr:4Fe-4S dicluster domain-containing protein [Calditrichota bacterium]
MPILPVFISYSLIVGLIGYFIIGFITATGHLRKKIQFVKLLVLYFLFLTIMNHYLILNFFMPGIQLLSTALIVTLIIIFDNFFKPDQDFDVVSEVKKLPRKYLRPHPFRTVLETIFRLFPLPEPVALYKVGNPDEKSAVVVTGNYELTVRRVANALQGLDCWLLICDSRGINVWCSSLSGHFSEKNIIHATKLTHLSEYVSHKRLVLPQLCAANVDIQEIKQKTGFLAVFGPVYIEHIKDFLNRSSDESTIRRVKFDLQQRVEMAISSPIILTTVLTFIYLFIDISKLLFIIPVVYFLAVVQAIIYPHRPIKQIPLWSFLYSFGIAVMITGLLILTRPFSFGWSIGIVVTIGVGMFYLTNEFEGWSPLVKYNLKSIYKGVDAPEITVNEEFCIGCRLCFQVCPKGVFTIENGKAKVLDRKECIKCSACYKRCPTEAIDHSSDKREKEKCACAYCRIQDSLKQ